LLAGLVTIPCAVWAAEGEGIGFREAWGWAVVVPVGAGSSVHEFLLDTGATFTVLEPTLAAELGLTANSGATRVTLSGEQDVRAGRADLALGPWALTRVEVLIAELPAIRSDEPRVRGLLGQSALSRLEYTIDHARRRLLVHRSLAAEPGAGALPRPTLEARLGCGSATARFVLDSGVGTPVLFRRGDLPLDVELGGPVRATTNSGQATWQEGRLRSLCVGGRRTGPVPVVVRPEASPARDEAGLLPSRFFARVRIGPAGAVLAVDRW
jgi:predicted aspartyl protease